MGQRKACDEVVEDGGPLDRREAGEASVHLHLGEVGGNKKRAAVRAADGRAVARLQRLRPGEKKRRRQQRLEERENMEGVIGTGARATQRDEASAGATRAGSRRAFPAQGAARG